MKSRYYTESFTDSEDEVTRLHSVIKKLEDTSSALETKFSALSEKANKASESHKVDSKQILDRIEVESQRAVDAFKNKLVDELKRYYRRSYDDVRNEPGCLKILGRR